MSQIKSINEKFNEQAYQSKDTAKPNEEIQKPRKKIDSGSMLSHKEEMDILKFILGARYNNGDKTYN